MKINDFLDPATLHETFVFLAQKHGLSGLDPQKPKKLEQTINFLSITKISPFWLNSWTICKIMQKAFLEDSVGSLAATCSKPCYSYRNIEVFKLPGRTRNAPKYQKW